MNKGFPDTTLTDEKGAVTLQGWLAQWRYVHTSPDLLSNIVY